MREIRNKIRVHQKPFLINPKFLKVILHQFWVKNFFS